MPTVGTPGSRLLITVCKGSHDPIFAHQHRHNLTRWRQSLEHFIIDEASQVNLLAAGLALSRCRNVVVVGDLRQLPHPS